LIFVLRPLEPMQWDGRQKQRSLLDEFSPVYGRHEFLFLIGKYNACKQVSPYKIAVLI
jgi:hypothetical protein